MPTDPRFFGYPVTAPGTGRLAQLAAENPLVGRVPADEVDLATTTSDAFQSDLESSDLDGLEGGIPVLV